MTAAQDVPDRSALRARLEQLRALLTSARASSTIRVRRRVGVLGFSGVGGSGKVAAETAEGLGRMGHEVVYLTGPDSVFSPAEVDVASMPMPREPEAAAASWVEPLADELARAMQSRALDVLFVHYVTGNLEAALRARCQARASTKIVAVLHGSDVTRFGRVHPQAQRMRDALASADEVVAVSGWLAHQATLQLSLQRHVDVIDNAVDVDRFRPGCWSSEVRRGYAPTTALLVGHVSNLRPVKRAGDVIESVARLRGRGLDARALLVGDGPELDGLERRAASSDVSGAVRFAGAVAPAHLPELVAACDLMLITSSSESFSLAAMEAMACGVPVISTRCGGLELAMNRLVSVGGFPPVAVGSARELAEGMRTLWLDPARYEEVARAGLRMAIEDYPRARQLAAYADVVERA